MSRDNKAFILSGYGAAKLNAESLVSAVRPGGRKIDPHPRVYRDEAPEELRNNPDTIWIKTPIGEWTFRNHTLEEKEEFRLNKAWRIEQVFKTILKQYGWQYAEMYVRENKANIDKYSIKIDLTFPHCLYDSNNQCDLFCPYFNQNCTYKGENNNED